VRKLDEPRVYLRKDTWWCYWRGERWSTGETDEAKARRVIHEHYDPRHSAARAVTIEDAIKLLYEALDRRGRAEATRKQARQKLGHFARLWKGKPLAEIDHVALGAYIDKRLSEYVDQARTKKVKRLTVSHELGYLRQAWKLARAQGWTPRAWDEVQPERFDRNYVPRTRWLTPTEVAMVIAALPEEQAAWVAWLVATGSDLGDVARAQKGDVDWKRQVVRVRGTKNVFRDRYVPILPTTKKLLELASDNGPPFEPWLKIQQALRRIAVNLGIDHFSPKDLRRTHGQWLRHAGVAPHLIGRVLGHADSVMADRVYGQGDTDEIAALVRAQASVHARTNVVRKPRSKRRSKRSSHKKTA
jgi:integrase